MSTKTDGGNRSHGTEAPGMMVRTPCPCCGVTLELNVPGKVTWRLCPNCSWYWSVSTDDHRPDLPIVGLTSFIVVCTAWQRAGHCLWQPGMRRYPEDHLSGVGPWKHLDSKALHPCTNRTGDAQITHEAGWTALGIEDRTCDSRPGSHSTFAIEAMLTFDDALALAREHFPEVIARIEDAAPIVLLGPKA